MSTKNYINRTNNNLKQNKNVWAFFPFQMLIAITLNAFAMSYCMYMQICPTQKSMMHERWGGGDLNSTSMDLVYTWMQNDESWPLKFSEAYVEVSGNSDIPEILLKL